MFNPKNNAGQTNETQNQILKNFITNTSDDIEKIVPLLEQKPRHNLTKQERIALRNLTNNNQIVINKADKGSTVVIQNKTDYIKEALKHLCDPKVYRKLNSDTTSLTKKRNK